MVIIEIGYRKRYGLIDALLVENGKPFSQEIK